LYHENVLEVVSYGLQLLDNAFSLRGNPENNKSSRNAIDTKAYELMGAQGCEGHADADLSQRIAAVIAEKLKSMHPGERIRTDVTGKIQKRLPRQPHAKNRSNPLTLNDLARRLTALLNPALKIGHLDFVIDTKIV
jgi:hypothetical protein